MSKITQALEKAARERLQRQSERVSVPSQPVEVPLVAPSAPAGTAPVAPAAAPVGRITIDPHIIAAADSKSPIAEQYRILRSNLQALRMRPGAKTIVITSAVHGEGKSVTAINLALTLARQENQRVVLVDADLRKSSIHHWLGLESVTEGLSTVLARGGELNGSLLKLQQPPLSILPAGPHPEHPAELLESVGFRRLLATLKTQYDVVIIDAPPVLPVADPGIIASQADGVLLVVRAGKTQRKTVTQAHATLKQVKANVLGCVLTHVEYYLPGYYRYYHYYQESKNGRGKSAGPGAGSTDATAQDVTR